MIGEHDESDAIAGAGGNEPVYLLAHRAEPVFLLPFIQHVWVRMLSERSTAR